MAVTAFLPGVLLGRSLGCHSSRGVPDGALGIAVTESATRRPVSRSRRPARLTAMTAGPLSPAACAVAKTSVTGVARLLATIALGVASAKRGVLDKPVVSALSKVLFNVFLPCTLFCNVASALTNAAVNSTPILPLLTLPLWAFLQVAIGYVLGKLLLVALRLTEKTPEGRATLVSCAFGNSAALPLLFSAALFGGTTLGPSIVSAISFFLLGWSPLFWAWGYSMVSGNTSNKNPEPRNGPDTQSMAQSLRQMLDAPVVARVLSPPIICSLLGVIVGSVPLLRSLITVPGSPAGIFFDAARTLGQAYTPAAVLVLSGSLVNSGNGGSGGKNKAESATQVWLRVAGISLVRFLLMPIIMFAVMQGVGPARVFFAKNPIVAFTVLLQATMPSAQNTVIMLNLEGQPDAASQIARILLFVYVIGVVPIAATLTRAIVYSGVL